MRRLLGVVLALAITLCCLPCGAAEASPQTPFSQDAAPTLLDTGRGYIAYSFYASAIYYSPDGVTWTDLSDRQWVRDARVYIALTSPMAHREFQLIWTGTEYMMRQALRDDPRSTHQRYGDSPRNSVVTLLDEDFQIIGQRAFDGPVTDIRYEDGVYYATTNGGETAFTREEWAAEAAATFSDVPADAWYAQGVELCAEKGIMVGTGENTFSPDATLTSNECMVLALRLYDLCHGGDGLFDPAPESWGVMILTFEDGEVITGDVNDTSIWVWFRLSRVDYGHPGFLLETEEQRAWGEGKDYQQATLTLDGESYPGYMHVLNETRTFLGFEAEDPHTRTTVSEYLRRYTSAPSWCRDATYYLDQVGDSDLLGMLSFQDGNIIHQNEVDRCTFAQALSRAAGELPETRQVDFIPGVPSMDMWYAKDAYALYRAGVLTGTDEFGTFDAEGTLTRAQAAVMVARVLDESLRVSAPLSTPEKN